MATEKTRRVAIFADNFKVGGIQKSLVNILTSGVLDQCEVDVFLFCEETFFDISAKRPNVHLHFLKPLPYWYRALPFGLLYLFHKPDPAMTRYSYDVAIDFDSYQNATALGALQVKAKKRVMWIHNDMQIKLKEEPKYAFLWWMMRGKYRRYTDFAAVSQGIVEPFRQASGRSDAPVHVIPNLIDTGEIFRRCQEEPGFRVDDSKLNIVSMGRLCHQKGYDLMLPDIRKVYDRRKDIAVYIIGDGPDRDKLRQQTEELGLEKVVHFTGNLPNPFPELRQMDVFCLESRYEGQGMVLWEAKALGLRLVFARRLEKYNPSLTGTDDIVEALVTAQKKEKTWDDLADYNQHILDQLKHLLN